MSAKKDTHIWQRCHFCSTSPIIGVRHECQTCPAGPDIDLCSSCFELYRQDEITHPVDPNYDITTEKHEFVAKEGEDPTSFYEWLTISAPDATAPVLEKGFLVRPEFCFGYDSSFGGYGFVVKTEKGRLMLTAFHVLDEVMKKNGINASPINEKYTGMELPEIIEKVNLYDVLEDKWFFHELGHCNNMIVLPNARVGDLEPTSYRDISAFHIEKNAKVRACKLAKQCPDVGEPIWLAAKSAGDQHALKAVVVQKNTHALIFRYVAKQGPPRNSSGAPLLDKCGNVVAINVGAGEFKGVRFGHANHVENIHNHLAFA